MPTRRSRLPDRVNKVKFVNTVMGGFRSMLGVTLDGQRASYIVSTARRPSNSPYMVRS